MKLITSMAITVLFPLSLFASGTNDMIQKVEKRLHTKVNTEKKQQSSTRNPEKHFLVSVTKAYDFLKSHNFSERSFFMYEVMRIFTMDPKERQKQLHIWIGKENYKIQERVIAPEVKKRWNHHVSSIRFHINGLSSVPTSNESIHEEITFLRELNADLHAFAKNSNRKESQNPKRQVIAVEDDSQYSARFLIASMMAAFLFGLLPVLIRKRTTSVNIPSLPEEQPPVFQTTIESLNMEEQDDPISDKPVILTNLEEECRRFFNEHDYVIKNAQIDIHPAPKSPFRTSIDVSPVKVREALEYFLKGTMSIVNSSRSKVASIDWTCTEAEGRVYLEFSLNGIQYDEKRLYYNTLVDGSGSAPAYFARIEEVLHDHLASVQVESSSHQTNIALGFEAAKNLTSYC